MNTLLRVASFILFTAAYIPAALSQDYLSTQGTTLPGIVYVNDSLQVKGKVSYNFTRVFVQPDNERTRTFLAQDVKGFQLEEGGGKFFSVPTKKGKSGLYELLSPESKKLYIVSPATSIDYRKNPKQNNTKARAEYLIYSKEEHAIIATKLQELSEYLKPRCEGLYTLISVVKSKTYVFGLLPTDEVIFSKYTRIIDDYTDNKCVYVPNDY